MRYTLFSLIALLSCIFCASAQEAIDIKPILSSNWHQHSPFNDATPFGNRNNKTPIGCGAVAAGQILNYHRTLDHGYGTKAYYSYGKNRNDSSLIIKHFEESKFNWGFIRNSYNNSNKKRDYSDIYAKSVADFLFQVSIAMHTHFNDGGSSTTTNGITLWGLHHHLHLSPKAIIRHRYHYTTDEWKALINEQLQANQPVYYAAHHNFIGKTGEAVRQGHAFVIDGVNPKGEYHANYGGGDNYKFTDLNILNNNSYQFPGNEHTCYSNSQRMITDFIQTETDTIYKNRSMMISSPIVINSNPYETEWTFNNDESFYLETSVQNYNIFNETLQYSLGVYKDSELYTVLDIYTITLPRIGSRELRRQFKLPDYLENGDYEMYLVSRNSDYPSWEKPIECLPTVIKMKVENDQIHLSIPPNRTLPSRLFLREPITEVKVPESNGTSFLLALKNPSQNNFENKLQINITVDGETHSFSMMASVYSGTEVDYHISIPNSALKLKNKSYTVTAEYFEHNDRTFKTLSTTEPPEEMLFPNWEE